MLTPEAKIASDFFFIGSIFAVVGFVSALTAAFTCVGLRMSSRVCGPARAGKIGRSCVHALCQHSGCRRASPLPHLSGLPCQYHRRVVATKFTTSTALAHPRAAGRRPRLLHLSGSPLVSTSGAWLGQCLPPRRPLGCKAILTSSARFVNPRRPSGKMHKISLSIQATLAKSPFIWKARLTFPSCRAILHPWKANFPRKEAAR